MQERGTSGNVTPPPSVNESEAQYVRTGHHVEEGSHAKNATSRLQSNIRRTFHWNRDFIGEDKSF